MRRKYFVKISRHTNMRSAELNGEEFLQPRTVCLPFHYDHKVILKNIGSSHSQVCDQINLGRLIFKLGHLIFVATSG